MSEAARIDRLAEALEGMLADPRAPRPSGDPELTELLRIAHDLRDLPSPSFRARLGADLSRRAAMSATVTGTTTRQGIRSVTLYLAVRPAVELIEFVKRAFGAEEMEIHREPAGTVVHAKIRVGGSVIEMGEAHGEWEPMPTMFYVYVDDVDAWYRRALAAGATSMEAPALQPYGDRRAAVRDAFDNQWYLAAPAS